MAQHFDDHSKLGSPRGAVHIIFRRTQGKLELVRLIKTHVSEAHGFTDFAEGQVTTEWRA